MLIFMLGLFLACGSPQESAETQELTKDDSQKLAQFSGKTELATFAGGCFLVCRSTL